MTIKTINTYEDTPPQKVNNESPFGRVVRLLFSSDEGIKMLSKYAVHYSYPDHSPDYEYYLPMFRDARLSIIDLTRDGNIFKFAPNFDCNDFTPLIQSIRNNMAFVTQDKYFDERLFVENPYNYTLGHPFVRNQFRIDCGVRLKAKFRQDVTLNIMEDSFVIGHNISKLSIRHEHWNRISSEMMNSLFCQTFGESVNVFPNSAVIAELDLLTRARLEVLERRHLTTVYRVRESGRVYQISKMDPERKFWIFNNFEEYTQLEPMDEIELFFKETPIPSIVFAKGKATYLKNEFCTAKIIEDKSTNKLSVTDFEFVPGVSEEKKAYEMHNFQKKVGKLGFYLPLAKFQTSRAKARFALFRPYFNSDPQDLYL